MGWGRGEDKGGLSSSHWNTAGFASASSIPLDYELLNRDQYASTRQNNWSSCSLRPDTGYKRALLSKRHSPVYNYDQEVFSGRTLKIKWENIAKPPACTGFMPFHHFSHLAGHSSLPGAMLEKDPGCSLERPSSPDKHGGNTNWFEPSCLLHTPLKVLLHKFASLFVS